MWSSSLRWRILRYMYINATFKCVQMQNICDQKVLTLWCLKSCSSCYCPVCLNTIQYSNITDSKKCILKTHLVHTNATIRNTGDDDDDNDELDGSNRACQPTNRALYIVEIFDFRPSYRLAVGQHYGCNTRRSGKQKQKRNRELLVAF